MSNTNINCQQQADSQHQSLARWRALFRFKSHTTAHLRQHAQATVAGGNQQGCNGPGGTVELPTGDAQAKCGDKDTAINQLTDRINSFPADGVFGVLAAKL